MKYGKKQLPIDENRRDTYKNAVDSDHGPPVLATLEGEAKQLMAVCRRMFLLLVFSLSSSFLSHRAGVKVGEEHVVASLQSRRYRTADRDCKFRRIVFFEFFLHTL